MRNFVKNVVSILALCSVAVSCATVNPVAAAKTTSQKAYALYGSFVVYEELDVALVVQPNVPVELKEKLKKVDSEAKPAADNLLDIARIVAKVQSEVMQGSTSQDKLVIVESQLESALLEATPKIQELINTVSGNK